MEHARNIISSLGSREVAERLGVKLPAISNAVSSGQFPAAWYRELRNLGQEKGVVVPDRLFNWRRAADDVDD